MQRAKVWSGLTPPHLVGAGVDLLQQSDLLLQRFLLVDEAGVGLVRCKS